MQVSETAIRATFDATAGKFDVTNGVLTSWEPKAFDRTGAEVELGLGDGD